MRVKTEEKKIQICMCPEGLTNVSLWSNGLLKTKKTIYRWEENERRTFSVSVLLWKTDFGVGFRLQTAAYNPRINLLHSQHIQLQIYLKYGYMTIYIYIHRCTFYKLFVCQVVLGLLRLSQRLLCQHLDYHWKFKGLWKRGRDTFLIFIIYYNFLN